MEVKFGGSINLKVFTTVISGAIYPGGSFKFTGSKGMNTSINSTNIKAEITQSQIKLTGTGTITSPIWPYPSYSGNISINPNWSTGSLETCIGSLISVDL